MRSQRPRLWLIAAMAPLSIAARLAAQTAIIDSAAVQIAAARFAMMYMPKTEDGRTTRGLNPMIIQGDVRSPELTGVRSRDTIVNARIAKAVDLVVRFPSQVCAHNGCELRDLAAYLSLSAPREDSNYVVLSANILTPNPRPHAVYYEPYRFGLRRDSANEWQVEWVDDLRSASPQRMWIVRTAPARQPNDEL